MIIGFPLGDENVLELLRDCECTKCCCVVPLKWLFYVNFPSLKYEQKTAGLGQC